MNEPTTVPRTEMTTLEKRGWPACAVVAGAMVLGCGGGVAGPGPDRDGGPDTSTVADAGPDATESIDAAAPDAVACSESFLDGDAGLTATVTVDTTSTVNTFEPNTLFGTNNGYWLVPGDVVETQPKVQAAGNYSIRYPGGSSSDDYHWNGSGAYDASHRWVPSDSVYSPGFPGTEMYRGTTSVSYGTPANVTDGDDTTTWLSNADTDFPNAQWVYVDLGGSQNVTSVAIDWAVPYATAFEVQVWVGASTYPPPYTNASTGWQTVSAGSVVGSGGTQTVAVTPVQAEFVRVLMTESSAGVAGAYSVAELRVFDGATQLTTNTAATAQSPTTASSTNPASAPLGQSNFDFESFMKYVASFTPAASPVITVNVGTGTPQEAAAWVHYANVVRGYGIRYWQIGNEMEGDWETGGPLNAQDYVRRYADYYTAMKAADPSIIVLGPVSGGIGELSNLDDGQTFIADFLSILHARSQDAYVDGIDFHWYPNYGTVAWTAALATTSQLGQFSSVLRGALSGTSVDPNVPVFMTEYNIGLGSPNTPVAANQLIDGLWTANVLGEFIRYFGAGGGTNLWNTISAGPTPDATDPTAGDLGYLQYNQNAYRYQERADYWAMQMMANDWAIAGDTRAHRLVASDSTQPLLAVYADERPDGVLALTVVNKSQSTAYRTSIQIAPSQPESTADVWTFDASNYAWETTSLPYHAEPDNAPTHAVYCGASSSTPFTFGPASITVIRFGASADAGAPPPARDAGASVLVDDMSDPTGAQIRWTPQHAGDVAGSWYTYIGGGAGPTDTGEITPLASSEVADGGSAQFSYTALGAGADSGIPGPAAADGGRRLPRRMRSRGDPRRAVLLRRRGLQLRVRAFRRGVRSRVRGHQRIHRDPVLDLQRPVDTADGEPPDNRQGVRPRGRHLRSRRVGTGCVQRQRVRRPHCEYRLDVRTSAIHRALVESLLRVSAAPRRRHDHGVRRALRNRSIDGARRGRRRAHSFRLLRLGRLALSMRRPERGAMAGLPRTTVTAASPG